MYDYTSLQRDIAALTAAYPSLPVGIAGKSVEGRNLYTIRLGAGAKEIFLNGAHHGQEWVTSWLLTRFVYDYLDALTYRRQIARRSIPRIFQEYSIYIMPMVNPDGVEMGKTVPGWQANAHGVDINHNYDAAWQAGKEYIAAAYGIDRPGPTRYSGPYPESELESRAVVRFTQTCDFTYVVAFHSQGEVIYWKFGDSVPYGGERLGRTLSAVSGYALDETTGAADYSGYKDWFIETYRRPGFTVEVGLGENPLPESEFETIYDKVLEIMLPYPV
jgi:g-D-glutamyl-meso-diaminopimelate peptidase